MAFYFKLALSLLFMKCTFSYQYKAKFRGAEYGEEIPDDYILVLRDLFSASTVDKDKWIEATKAKLKDRYGCLIEKELKFHNFNAFRVKMDKTKAEKLLYMKEINLIELNRKVYASPYTHIGESVPDRNDSQIKVCYQQDTGRNLWGLSRISRRDSVPNSGDAYFDSGPMDDGYGVDAYVIDTGIFVEHEQFDGRAVWGYTASAIADSEEDTDLNGHGTHVAGTIGGRTYGVAKSVNLIAVKVLDYTGTGTMFDVIEGIEYAFNDYKDKINRGLNPKGVCNLSLGARGEQVSLEMAIERAINGGLTFVIAAGNDYDDACFYTPAKVPGAITVGSVNIDDTLSEFSNFGTCVDILAPGEAILSSYTGSTSAVALLSGTSMASPHVSGVVARYLSTQSTSPTCADVKNAIIEASTRNAIDLNVGDRYIAREETANRLVYFTCGGDLMRASGSSLASTKFSVIFTVISFQVIVHTWSR